MNNLYKQILNQALQNRFNTPQIQAVMELVNNSNKTPRDLFYEKAREMGVDPEEILRKIR